VHSISRWTVVRETLAIRDVVGPKTNPFSRGVGDLQGRGVFRDRKRSGWHLREHVVARWSSRLPS